MTQQRWSLRNKVALVTGATAGTGLAVAEELTRFGAKVIRVARKNADINADVSIAEDRARIFQSIEHRDILVNNAGKNLRKKAIEDSYDEYERLPALNTHAA